MRLKYRGPTGTFTLHALLLHPQKVSQVNLFYIFKVFDVILQKELLLKW